MRQVFGMGSALWDARSNWDSVRTTVSTLVQEISNPVKYIVVNPIVRKLVEEISMRNIIKSFSKTILVVIFPANRDRGTFSLLGLHV